MHTVRVGAFLLSAVFLLSAGCYSPDVKTPANEEEDLFEGTSMDPNAGPVNEAPPPKKATEPDMDYIKDMLRRSAEQAAQCDGEENAGPRGTATVEVTFRFNGRVSDITVYPPHEGTPIGACVKRAFEGIFVTGWSGDPLEVKVERKVEFGKKEQEPAE